MSNTKKKLKSSPGSEIIFVCDVSKEPVKLDFNFYIRQTEVTVCQLMKPLAET